MSRDLRWLFSEVDRWTAEKIISAEQAAGIRRLYPVSGKPRGVPWALVVFSCAGATVVGLGVILLLAYNWDELPKFAKLALVFGAILGGQLGGLSLLGREGWKPMVGEALCLLGTISFGAGIWLVAQIYHIDEHFPNGFLVWALGALAMAWALQSAKQAVLATILFTIWGSSEAWSFDSPSYWAIVAVMGGAAPLAWRLRSTLLTVVVLASIYFLTVAVLGGYGGGAHAVTSTLALSALLIAGGRLIGRKPGSDPGPTNAMIFVGFAGFLVCCYLLGFHEMANDLLDWDRRPDRNLGFASTYGWLLAACGLAGWGGLAWRALKAKTSLINIEEWLCPIALVYAYLLASLRGFHEAHLVASTFNLVFLAIAIMWMLRGCRESRLWATVLGSLLFAALVLARYFDLFESLFARGLTFVILGGVLFAEAFYFHRVRRDITNGGTHP